MPGTVSNKSTGIYKMKNILILLITIVLFLNSGLNSAGLKKVLVLDFVNIEQKPDFKYLEDSITDAVKNELARLFAFKETPRYVWEDVARANYLYRNDWNTKSVAMNLGLLSKQDVVIAGGYRVGSTGNSTNGEHFFAGAFTSGNQFLHNNMTRTAGDSYLVIQHVDENNDTWSNNYWGTSGTGYSTCGAHPYCGNSSSVLQTISPVAAPWPACLDSPDDPDCVGVSQLK